VYQKKAAFGTSERRFSKYFAQDLEGEIETAAHHAEVVLRTIDDVPAEIINPADMWCKSDLNPSAELADQFCLGICILCADNAVTCDKACPFPAAKDTTTASKDVRCESRAGNGIAKRQSS
jgi:hypothetical protein